MKLGLVSSTNDTFSLYKWNSYYSELYLLNMILLTIGLIIGTCGNATVIFVYQRGFKHKGQSWFLYFFFFLAIIDLMCVLVSATFNMLRLTRHVAFSDSWVCKLFVFSVRVILGHSLLIVTAIAVSSFKQICYNIKYPINTSHLRIFFICSGKVSAISYIPTFFLFSELSSFTKKTFPGTSVWRLIDTDACTLDRWNLAFIAVLHWIRAFIITALYV